MGDLPSPRSDATRCFVCGPENPLGLQVRFAFEDGRCVGRFTPAAHHNGFDGVTHGGIVFSLLDDAMGNWLFLQGARGVTAKCEIRYRQAWPTGVAAQVSVALKQRKGRVCVFTAELLRLDDRSVIAEAEASFVVEDFGALAPPA